MQTYALMRRNIVPENETYLEGTCDECNLQDTNKCRDKKYELEWCKDFIKDDKKPSKIVWQYDDGV